LKPDWKAHAAARRLLVNEALVAKSVKSHHVVAAAPTQPFNPDQGVLLEWLDGTTLESRLQEERSLSVATSVWIARQCAAGLLALEQAGFAHGDVKPANLFLARTGEVKLVDLGFCRSIRPGGNSGSSPVLTGTAEYLAPESLSRHESNPVLRDVYSLGVTLFRMLTGELPFAAETTSLVLQLQRTARPPILRRKRPEVSAELARLVQQMLAKQPIRRPANLRSLVRTLIDFELDLFPQRQAG
jgi:serine/threonine protein kinase